jgi:hypothetical protein
MFYGKKLKKIGINLFFRLASKSLHEQKSFLERTGLQHQKMQVEAPKNL